MPRSNRRRANRRSAAEKSPVRRTPPPDHRQQDCSDDNQSLKRPQAEIDGSAADRYYAMAEEMNTRGAMELAVPFYRQAVALLLAERQSFRQQLGDMETCPVGNPLPMDALNGLLKAAETLGQSHPVLTSEPSSELETPSLDEQIAELAAELCKENALQVIAGLRSLAETNAGQLPVSGLSLLGKAQMLLGKVSDGLKSFEAALAKAPDDREVQINTGAARLAGGDVQNAIGLLRSVWSEGLESLQVSSQQALLRNLSAAESKAGSLANALQLRLKWFHLYPETQPLERWLRWAKQGLVNNEKSSPERQVAMNLLQELHKAHPKDRDLLQQLADALEYQGEYREAAVIYRKLLRPNQL